MTSNFENLAPKEIGCLSDASIASLCLILGLTQELGHYPSLMSELLVRLIENKDGGTRPILLFRAVYRVHMRARQLFAKKWEAKWATAGINNSPNTRILDGS
jgi:hypothetical protein